MGSPAYDLGGRPTPWGPPGGGCCVVMFCTRLNNNDNELQISCSDWLWASRKFKLNKIEFRGGTFEFDLQWKDEVML